MAEKHCKLCADCIHHGTCFREGNKRAYNGDLDISGCEYYKSAVNFVEVVRCKDCTHSQYSKGIGYICEYDNKCRHGMNYCSEGVTREDSTEDSIDLHLAPGVATAYWTRAVQIKDALIEFVEKTTPADDTERNSKTEAPVG